MSTTYKLPEGVTSVAANGQTFHADEHGHIDVTAAYPGTLAALIDHAGIVQVKSDEDLALETAEAAEKARFDAEVAAMLEDMKRQTNVVNSTVAHVVEQTPQEIAAEHEAAMAERTVREAAVAAAPVEQIEPATSAEDGAAVIASGVIPPRRAKKA